MSERAKKKSHWIWKSLTVFFQMGFFLSQKSGARIIPACAKFGSPNQPAHPCSLIRTFSACGYIQQYPMILYSHKEGANQTMTEQADLGLQCPTWHKNLFPALWIIYKPTVRRLDTLGIFSTMFYKWDSFCDILCIPAHQSPPEKGPPFQKGENNLYRVASLGSVCIGKFLGL